MLRFAPECFADTTLITFFVGNKAPIDHEAGLNEVANAMKKSPTTTFIGLIDNDKTQPKYFDDFREISSKNGVSFKKKPNHEHYLIILNPAFEKFLIENAIAVGLKFEDYTFPNDLKGLTRLTKKAAIKTDSNFQQLLRDLKQRNAMGFIEIENIIHQFI